MSAENIIKINKQREAGARFVREHQKGRGGVGFGNVDTDPLVSNTWEVIGKSFKKVTKEGEVIVYPKARVVELSDGSIDILSGGIGAAISEVDARKILGKKLNLRLTKSLKHKK